MKSIILSVFLLIGHYVYAQIGIVDFGGATISFSGTTLQRSSQTYVPGHVYLMMEVSSSLQIPTVSSTGLTWNFIDTVSYNTTTSPTYRVCYWWATPAATTTTTVDFTYSPAVVVRAMEQLDLTGVDTRIPIVTYVKGKADGSSTATVTMPTMAKVSDAQIFFLCNVSNPFGGTAESGWTEILDRGAWTSTQTNPMGLYTMYQKNATDLTPTVTMAASQNWGGIGFEIRPPLPRRVSIN